MTARHGGNTSLRSSVLTPVPNHRVLSQDTRRLSISALTRPPQSYTVNNFMCSTAAKGPSWCTASGLSGCLLSQVVRINTRFFVGLVQSDQSICSLPCTEPNTYSQRSIFCAILCMPISYQEEKSR